MSTLNKPNNPSLAELAVESGMMPVIKEFARHFGNNGKLPAVAIFYEGQLEYVGPKPVKTKRVAVTAYDVSWTKQEQTVNTRYRK